MLWVRVNETYINLALITAVQVSNDGEERMLKIFSFGGAHLEVDNQDDIDRVLKYMDPVVDGE